MTWLPWTVLRVLWQLASFGATRAHGLLPRCGCSAGPGRRRPHPLQHVRGIVVTTTALGLWLEPVRTTFNYGQINLFLCRAAARRRGGGQGMAGRGLASGSRPGIKLTPAITGLYYLLQTRLVRGGLVGRVLRGHGRASRLAILPTRDLAVLHRADVRPGPHRTGLVGDQPVAARRARPARRATTSPPSGWCGRGAGCPSASGRLGSCLRAGDRCRRIPRRADHRPADLADLLVPPLGVGAAAAAVVPVRAAAAAHRRCGCWRSPGSSRTCSYVVSILIAQQYIDQPASRPFWQSGARRRLPAARAWSPWSLLGRDSPRRGCAVRRRIADPVTPPVPRAARSDVVGWRTTRESGAPG